MEGSLLILLSQVAFAYLLTVWLAPRYLKPASYLPFGLYLLLSLFALVVVYCLIRKHYLEPKYLAYYQQEIYNYQPIQLSAWLSNPHVLLGKSVLFSVPGFLLLMMQYYRRQRRFAQLNAQKKVAELNALKNQLNPHFLFNTLNNLYSLTLLKSDKAPEVIAHLSDMLDYMLYQTKDPLVSLDREVELLQNYLALEMVRYGDRVSVVWDMQVQGHVRIAPLILLTFLENAFKHGVKEETAQADIRIRIKTDSTHLMVEIENSLPTGEAPVSRPEALGLENIQQQLTLLYPEGYEYLASVVNNRYRMQLKLPQK